MTALSRTASRIALIGNGVGAFVPFRTHFVRSLVSRGHDVHLLLPRSNARWSGGHAGTDIDGVTEHDIPLDAFSINPARELRAWRAVHRSLAALRADAVVNFTVKPVVYGSLAAAAAKTPHIFSVITGLGYLFVADDVRRKIIRAGVERLYRAALAHNRLVFFQNHDDSQLFVDRSLVDGARVRIIGGSGVDVGHFRSRGTVSETPTFTFIGRLLVDKGLREFIAAAKLLKRRHPSTRFVAVGPASHNPGAATSKELDAWRADGIVDFIGPVDDVRPFMESSWAVVLPSYREGCSRVILETMSMGRPVVTTDVPGCRGTVEHGKHGLLVPPRDAQSLAEAMEILVRSPSMRLAMGESARNRAVECFDEEQVTCRLVHEMNL